MCITFADGAATWRANSATPGEGKARGCRVLVFGAGLEGDGATWARGGRGFFRIFCCFEC